MAPGPETTLGRYFSALGRHDVEQIKYWQRVLHEDIEAQDAIDVMAEYAVAELVAAGPKKFGNREIARIHRSLGARGFQYGLFEVQRVLAVATGQKANLDKLSVGQLIKMRVGLFDLIALSYGISESALDEAVVRAEERVRETPGR